jgi:hypothetical protein
MSLENFIPQVWSASILRALQTSLVYPQLMNQDYDGDIESAGDTVKINMIGDVDIFDYVKNTDLAPPQTLTDAQLMLAIDQSKAFNFAIDDIDKAQQSPKVMGEAANRAAYGLKKATDAFCASHYTDISPANFIGSDGSPITGTWATPGQEAYDRLIDLGTLLDENDVPDEGRFAVVPPWFEGYLNKDLRFTSFGTQANLARLAEGNLTGAADSGISSNGLIGHVAGFEIYKSNQVPQTSGVKYKIIAGHPMAWSFADQILEVEGYRPQARFGDALKGLHVYGAKVVRPYALALLTANPT